LLNCFSQEILSGIPQGPTDLKQGVGAGFWFSGFFNSPIEYFLLVPV
jgi:hypothetical protein